MSEWYETIREYEEEKNINLNTDPVCKKSINPVAVGYPTYIHMYNNTVKKQKHNWQQYVTNESDEITATPEIQTTTTEVATEVAPTEISPTLTVTAPKRKWAYAYLIGGCSSQTPKYYAYIYNAIVVSRRMKEYGSKADIVVMIQMWGKSDETALPQEDVDMLEDAGVKIVYIPKLAPYMQEVFYTLMLEKFRILTLTDYSRVLYMDGDVIPTCNLDYLFDLSEPEDGIEPVLKENLILAWKGEPASGGFFMFRPDMDDWAVMQQVIRDREEEILTMEYPWWNATIGWGHQIELPDFWDAPSSKGNEWTWYGAFADQVSDDDMMM